MMSLERVLMGSALLLILGSAHGQEDGNVFTQGGSQPGAAPCVACHGADGLGLAAAGFPRLAGLPAGYLRKQLEDFKSGARSSPVMQPLAKALTEEEIGTVTQALAAMPAPAAAALHRSVMPADAAQKSPCKVPGIDRFLPVSVAMGPLAWALVRHSHPWQVNLPPIWLHS